MTHIHPLAVVAPTAEIGARVEIGPFCVVEAGAVIGDGCRLAARVTIREEVFLGPDNEVCEGAVIGGRPQHLRAGPPHGTVVIGRGNQIRENVTIHRGLHPGDATRVGDGGLIMVNAHVAHDCVLGSHVILANNVMLAGHITVGDRAYLSGGVAVHQFCRIGAYAMVGGQAHIKHDVPPYVNIDGYESKVVGLNLIGLRRNGFRDEQIAQLKGAYRIIYRSGLKWADVLAVLRTEYPEGPAAAFHEFLSGGQRGFMQEREAPHRLTLRLPERTAEPAADEAAAAPDEVRRAG